MLILTDNTYFSIGFLKSLEGRNILKLKGLIVLDTHKSVVLINGKNDRNNSGCVFLKYNFEYIECKTDTGNFAKKVRMHSVKTMKKQRDLNIREQKILSRLLNGYSVSDISKIEGLSKQCIYCTRDQALGKLGVKNIYSLIKIESQFRNYAKEISRYMNK